MRVAVVGGTRFIGRRIVELLAGRGDQVMVVHRGITEPGGPDGWVDCRHLHVDRSGFAGVADQVRRFRPDAVIDSDPGTAADVGHVLPHLPDVHLVVLSSMDVYRAYGLARAGREGEGLPIDETSAPRDERYPYRGLGWGEDDYDKLDVEPAYLARGGTVLRLPRTYGRHDPLRREEFVLRRMRAGRPRIPIGAGTTLWTRGHVDDVAAATLAALGHPAAPGEVFNVGEPTTRSIPAGPHRSAPQRSTTALPPPSSSRSPTCCCPRT